MDKVTVSHASTSDIPIVLELLYQLGRPVPRNDLDSAYFERLLRMQISDREKGILVAETPDRGLVGVLAYVFLPRLNRTGPEMYIPELVVLKGCRRMGVGRRLIEASINLAKERGCYGIRLESANWRLEAHKFYKDLKFDQSSLSFSMSL